MHPDRGAIEPSYFPSLTGLRGVAAVWVMLLHLWYLAGMPPVVPFGIRLTPVFFGGGIGVDLFFVLSGFLLGLPFVAWAQRRRPLPNLARYAKRRCLRVLPAYWAQLGILIAVAAVATGASPVTPGGLLAYLSMEFVFVPGLPLLNGVWWTLPVEWNFYLVLPLMALGFRRLGWATMALLGLAAAVAVRLCCYELLHRNRLEGLISYPTIIQLPGRIDEFVFGMLGAWFHLRAGAPARTLRTAALVAGLLGIGVFLWVPDPRGDIFGNADAPRIFWHASLVGALWALVVYGAAAEGRLARILFASPAMTFLGTVSYSLYLWHSSVFALAQHVGLTRWAPAASLPMLMILLIPVVLLVAWVSFRCTERPFLVTEPAAHQRMDRAA